MIQGVLLDTLDNPSGCGIIRQLRTPDIKYSISEIRFYTSAGYLIPRVASDPHSRMVGRPWSRLNADSMSCDVIEMNCDEAEKIVRDESNIGWRWQVSERFKSPRSHLTLHQLSAVIRKQWDDLRDSATVETFALGGFDPLLCVLQSRHITAALLLSFSGVVFTNAYKHVWEC